MSGFLRTINRNIRTGFTPLMKTNASIYSALSMRSMATAAHLDRNMAFSQRTQDTEKNNLLMPQTPSVSEWTPQSKRCGAIGQKMGMMQVWDNWGNQLQATVVRVQGCQVVQVKDRLSRRGEMKLQLGFGDAKPKRLNKPQLVHFRKHGVTPKRKVREFFVTPDAVLPQGFTFSAMHFQPGQFVDVQGTTKGNGFTGVMKRWGFKGQPASHGVSLTHRSLGSTGACQNPGKVWKGKKMAGKTGNINCTQHNLRVFKIDPQRDLVWILGHVPGNAGDYVMLNDANKRSFTAENPPPFPSYFRKEGEELPSEIVMDPVGVDEYAEFLIKA